MKSFIRFIDYLLLYFIYYILFIISLKVEVRRTVPDFRVSEFVLYLKSKIDLLLQILIVWET